MKLWITILVLDEKKIRQSHRQGVGHIGSLDINLVEHICNMNLGNSTLD